MLETAPASTEALVRELDILIRARYPLISVTTFEEGRFRRLMEAVVAHPDLQNLRRFSLVSTSARGLYEKFGWAALNKPESYMERFAPDVYLKF